MSIEWKIEEHGECDRMDEVPEGATILSVDDKTVMGISCGHPIVDEDDYDSDSEGIIWHKVCPEDKRSDVI